MKKPGEVVDEYLRAIGDRDFERAREHLSDSGFRYVSPIGNFTDADRFIENISRIGPIIEGLDIRKLFISGNEVVTIVDTRITLYGFATRTAAMLFRVEDGRIMTMEVIFDASDYYKMFERPEQV